MSKEDKFALACQGLYMVALGMDLTKDESWTALMACANCIAERFPQADMAGVMLTIESEVRA